MTTTVNGIEGLRELIGTPLPPSEWHEVTQEQVNQFADATGDHQWIHVDPERAKAGPFGGPIAHGYLTLSLASYLLPKVWRVEGFSMGVNYGLNKLRFPSPVPVGGKVRLNATLADLKEISGGVEATVDMSFEVEGKDKPACVAQAVYRYYS
ncbi:MAG TPA: MaoC family dehydratase [Acidimicrobiales bacterium]|nr:MaoC family dehydratase [Acidimicrobiales bacterium]